MKYHQLRILCAFDDCRRELPSSIAAEWPLIDLDGQASRSTRRHRCCRH
jgi:hypothetical protein